MKYQKCACCSKQATKKFRGIKLCEECLKVIRRANARRTITGVYGEKLAFSMGDLSVYKTVFIPCK